MKWVTGGLGGRENEAFDQNRASRHDADHDPPYAFAGTEKVCNAAFCNATTGDGLRVSKVVATKIGQNRGIIGFFELFGPRGLKKTGATTSANGEQFTFPADSALKKGELLCLRFFAKASGGGFVEVGTAQCTKSPF